MGIFQLDKFLYCLDSQVYILYLHNPRPWSPQDAPLPAVEKQQAAFQYHWKSSADLTQCQDAPEGCQKSSFIFWSPRLYFELYIKSLGGEGNEKRSLLNTAFFFFLTKRRLSKLVTLTHIYQRTSHYHECQIQTKIKDKSLQIKNHQGPIKGIHRDEAGLFHISIRSNTTYCLHYE